jgi:tetratricopeptide (TPR) repeat protein
VRILVPGRFANLEFDNVQRRQERRAEELRTPAQPAVDHLQAAEEESRWGRFEPALRLYTRALQENRAAIPAWVGQVQMLVQLGEYHEARVWSDKALELFRNNGELLAAKAQACARLKDLDAALACSDAALQAQGSSAWRWTARGEVLLARRQKFADQCFQKAGAEPGATWFDRVVIARICQYYGRISNAMQYAKEALQLEPTHGYAWFTLGDCQRALGFMAAAEASYGHCLEFRGDYREARAALDALPAPSWRAWLGARLHRWRGR